MRSGRSGTGIGFGRGSGKVWLGGFRSLTLIRVVITWFRFSRSFCSFMAGKFWRVAVRGGSRSWCSCGGGVGSFYFWFLFCGVFGLGYGFLGYDVRVL